ncbi:MAG: helix-turn-helix domain-containing protein [Methanobrevibacter sp.]|jgi:putative transposase|nr:helix-turn-helix domain-containing protein [Candidatus Methanovirga basalitermitum]
MEKEVNKSYKYRIYPDFKQEQYLFRNIGATRFVFNQLKGMSDFQYKYPCYGNSIDFNPFNKYSCIKYSKKLKDCFDTLNDVDATNIQNTAKIFGQAMLNTIKSGFGFVKFKSRKNTVQSFSIRNINNRW